MNPAPVPETAQLDPWSFLDDIAPINVDTDIGGAMLALHTAQLTWAVGVLKQRVEFLEKWAEEVGEVLDPQDEEEET